MPIYDYLCVFCNDRVERQVPIDERDQQTCSHCGFGISRLVSPTPGKVKGRADAKSTVGASLLIPLVYWHLPLDRKSVV